MKFQTLNFWNLNAVDLYCGGGGTSTGMRQAAEKNGFKLNLVAVNHWDRAIATHTANHPESLHLCTGVDEVVPADHHKEGLDILWASPSCTNHSRAKGGKPRDDQSRAGANCVLAWAAEKKPTLIFVENVAEVTRWGVLYPCDHPDPNLRLMPDKAREGELFQEWLMKLRALGYKVAYKTDFCFADYGAPTSRSRFILQAVREGCGDILWPEKTHWDPKLIAKGETPPGAVPWRTARTSVINWNHQGRWLDEMPGKARYGGLPLSPKTMKRILHGLLKHGLKAFSVPPQTGATRTRSIDIPLQTICCESARGIGLTEPFVVKFRGTSESQVKGSSESVDVPLGTVTGGGIHHGIIDPYVVPQFGERQDPRAHSVDKPLPAVTSHGAGAVVEPYIVPIDNTGRGDVTTNSIDTPLTTVVTEARHCVVEPFLAHTAHAGEGRTISVDAPMPTVAGNRGDLALIHPAAFLLPQHSCGALRDASAETCPTVATSGAIALVEAHAVLIKYYGTAMSKSTHEPLDTVTSKDRFALLIPEIRLADGNTIRVRLRWRMLQPDELSAAQSFPRDYKYVGNKSETVKQIGNAVPPAGAEAILDAYLKAGRFAGKKQLRVS